MSSRFEDDQPGEPRILFIGLGHSSHTHSWIDLFEKTPLNVRLFCTSADLPPPDWKVKTYVIANDQHSLDPVTRKCLWDDGKASRFIHNAIARARGRDWNTNWLINDWLLGILRDWKPHIVHTLGLDAARFYLGVRRKLADTEAPRWVLQTRGGSDLQLAHLDPKMRREIASVLRACDQMLSDNTVNYRIARELGVREDQLSRIGTVPGTGGIDIDALASKWRGRPSQRRVILWPKAAECPWSKALPVFEAVKLCWDRIQPCQLYMLSMCPESRMYYWTLPDQIRAGCHVSDRIPRTQTIEMMTEARVMLAPSLVDGTPNSMFEAMAAGALPIVSPLESIRTVVEEDRNVLFARNLYPEEIAGALVCAMTDDELVESVTQRNLELVRRIANRDEVRERLIRFYECLVGAERLPGLTERSA
jgi:glycosyltransferase involved in cell wall biosynthesis